MSTNNTKTIVIDIWNANTQTRETKLTCANKTDAMEKLKPFLTERKLGKYEFDSKYKFTPSEWTNDECEQILGRDKCASLAKDVFGTLFMIYVTSQ
jgi:hypothetical protein